MKKNDTLNGKALQPKKSTIDFLLRYSKGLAIVQTQNLSVAILKN